MFGEPGGFSSRPWPGKTLPSWKKRGGRAAHGAARPPATCGEPWRLLLEDRVLQRFARAENRHPARPNLDGPPRLGVPADARRPLAHLKAAKTDQLHLISLGQRRLDRFEHRVDRGRRFLLGKVSPGRDLVDELRLVHLHPPHATVVGRRVPRFQALYAAPADPLQRIMQMRPPLPSFRILVSVSCSFFWALAGMRVSLLWIPSLTRSCSDLPRKSEFHTLLGSFSNSSDRYRASSSPCFSVPTKGVTSVTMFARTMWIDGALACSLMPNWPPRRTISGSLKLISSSRGVTMPYPVSSTCARASANLSYSALAWARSRMRRIKW